jgi:predicted alpha-1,6-mannanase (GH76 family)
MWKAKHASLPVACMLLFLFLSRNAPAVTQAVLKTWGAESITQLRIDFRLSSGLYAQSLTERFPSYAWGQGILFGSLVAAAKADSTYLAEAQTVAGLIQTNYWRTCNGYSGFNASSGNCGDRYTDDNAWIALALLELYEITNNSTYLTQARNTVAFCMAFENGTGDTPNGGIRWHETSTCGANVCSTGPTCLVNLIIYQKTGIASYLTDGQRLYNWLITSGVQNPAMGLYYQDLNCSGVPNNLDLLGYETALPLQAALRLYQITGSAGYLAQAQRLATKMEAQFVNAATHAFGQQGYWGGHDMTNALVDLYKVDGYQHWLDVAAGYLQYLHDNCKFSGRYPDVWNNTNGAASPGLLANASVARAYWTLATTAGGSAPACASTPIVPYIAVNSGAFQQVIRVTLNVDGKVTFYPQPSNGTWSWSGPAGFSHMGSTFSIYNILASQAGDYIATYTNPCGTKSYCPFTITVTCEIADINCDTQVDIEDFMILCQEWLSPSTDTNADLWPDHVVDMKDYLILSENWLR